MIETFYERIGRGFSEIIPKKTKEKTIFPRLLFAGVKESHNFWIGKRIFSAILIGFVGFLLPWTAGKFFNLISFEAANLFLALFYSFALSLMLPILLLVLFYVHLFYQIEGRAALVEEILPDFLMLVASNVNAGMTPVFAFRSAARKEFGPLSEEIKSATAKSLGTQSLTDALRQVSTKIRSRVLEETVSFFSQSLRSGGHLSKLLETSANDLRQTQEMKKELIASTKMYIIFVGFIVVIATPVLMGISVQFLKMISSIQAQNPVGLDVSGSVSFLSTKLLISPEFMQLSAYLLLVINSLLSSLFMGMLATGKPKLGLKNFPLLLIASLIVFFISTQALEQFLAI